MLAALMMHQGARGGSATLPSPTEVLRLKKDTIPEAVILKGTKAISAFLAEQITGDIEFKTARKVAGAKPSATVAEAVQIVNAEAADINDEIALLFILASLE